MAILRAAAVFSTPSGLARDRVVNTFHFEGESVNDTWVGIAAAVRQFYADATGITGGLPLAAYLSSVLQTLDVHVYEVPGTLEASGRETPTGVPVFSDLGAAGAIAAIGKASSANLPNEVAVCVSYQGTPAPGFEQSRRRGRIYVGPLNNGAKSEGADGPRPSATFRTIAGEAYSRLTADIDPNAEAVVYSRPFAGRAAVERVDRPDLPALAPRPAVTVGIDQIWVDDEFDTQRRRGLRRTGRTLVTAAG